MSDVEDYIQDEVWNMEIKDRYQQVGQSLEAALFYWAADVKGQWQGSVVLLLERLWIMA